VYRKAAVVDDVVDVVDVDTAGKVGGNGK